MPDALLEFSPLPASRQSMFFPTQAFMITATATTEALATGLASARGTSLVTSLAKLCQNLVTVAHPCGRFQDWFAMHSLTIAALMHHNGGYIWSGEQRLHLW